MEGAGCTPFTLHFENPQLLSPKILFVLTGPRIDNLTHRTGGGDGKDVCGIVHTIGRMGYCPTSINALLLDCVDGAFPCHRWLGLDAIGDGAAAIAAVAIHSQIF